MSKKGGKKFDGRGRHPPITLRQEAAGLKPTSLEDGGGVPRDPRSMLKLDHLQRLSTWASGAGSAPSLAALFGRRLAAGREALAVLPDPSLVTCQRCEAILQPGYNCTIRVKKSRAKKRQRSQKPRTPTQNNVVYSCQFCLHRNVKRGTPKGHMKVLHPAKARPISQKKSKTDMSLISSNLEIKNASIDERSKISTLGFSAAEPLLHTSGILDNGANIYENSQICEPGFPVSEAGLSDNKLGTPVTKHSLELLSESRRRKRNRSSAKKSAEPEGGPASAEASVGTSKKRRKRSWTTLREIAERSESGMGKSISDLKIPFLI
ncbi:hypothetical protein MLD38_016496 [Melastoma candidum]|uniref:Uncharacterized protein n=1 Tax=Melastoma candidum TaxID=119954 RepID=A0ACB9QMI3_9MYRT|nr:hypothetical protein MLD38_016496 [Melastoma candidum]